MGKYDKARFGEKCFWRSSSSNAEAVNLHRAWQVRGQKEDQFGHLWCREKGQQEGEWEEEAGGSDHTRTLHSG